MKKHFRTISIAAAALTVGLVVGSIGIAVAAPNAAPGDPAAGFDLRMGPAFREAGATLADIVARLTGQDVDDVRDARADGKSVADIAEEAGVSTDAVIDEALTARAAVLEERVAAGDLTDEQADDVLANRESRMADRIDDATVGGCGRGGGGFRGGQSGPGACGGACINQ